MLPRGWSMIALFLKSAASALSSVARVRAPLTIAKARTWGSLDAHAAVARRRCSSWRILSASTNLRRPARSSVTSCRLRFVDESQASCSLQRHKLPADVLIPREFFSELTCGDEAGRAALPKKPVDDSAGLHEELGRDVCVNNEAHVRYPEDRALL